MQDVALAGKAVPSLTSEVKGLDTRQRDPDRVSVVAMRRERLTMEMSLQALDPRGPRPNPDAVAAGACSYRLSLAQAFKTVAVVGR